MNIRYARHARNRMRLYDVSEDDVRLLLERGERQSGRGTSLKAEGAIEGIGTTIVFHEEDDEIVVLTVWSDIKTRRGA